MYTGKTWHTVQGGGSSCSLLTHDCRMAMEKTSLPDTKMNFTILSCLTQQRSSVITTG